MEEYTPSSMFVKRGEDEQEVDIEGYVLYTIDRNYGADADGNRASSRTFVQAVRDIKAYTTDGSDFELNANEESLASEILTKKFLEG